MVLKELYVPTSTLTDVRRLREASGGKKFWRPMYYIIGNTIFLKVFKATIVCVCSCNTHLGHKRLRCTIITSHE